MAQEWVSIGNGDESALHMEHFATEYQTTYTDFVRPFFQDGYFRFGYVVAFALAAAVTVRLFNFIRTRVW